MVESVAIEPLASRQRTLVRRLVRGGAWVFAGRTAGVGFVLLANMILARNLSPGEFGQFLTAVSIIGFLSIIARFGLDRILVRFISEGVGAGNAPLVTRTLWIAFSVGLASTLSVAVLATGTLAWFQESLELPRSVLVLLGASIPMFTILYLSAESFRGFHQLRYASLFQAQSGPLTTLAFVSFLMLAATAQPSLPRALVCYVLSAACILPFAFLFLSRIVKRHLPKEANAPVTAAASLPLSRALSICAPVAVSDTLSFTAANAGLWIAASCCSEDDLALFASARQLVVMVALPLNLINMTVISSISELHSQGRLAELQRMLQITATTATVLTLLIVLVFLVLPGTVLHVVFGPFYAEASQLLIILSLARLVSAWTGSCLNTLLLTGRHQTVLWMNVSLLGAMLVLGPLSARTYGATGIAVATAVILTTLNLVAWAVTRVKVGVWTNATLRVTGQKRWT